MLLWSLFSLVLEFQIVRHLIQSEGHLVGPYFRLWYCVSIVSSLFSICSTLSWPHKSSRWVPPSAAVVAILCLLELSGYSVHIHDFENTSMDKLICIGCNILISRKCIYIPLCLAKSVFVRNEFFRWIRAVLYSISLKIAG